LFLGPEVEEVKELGVKKVINSHFTCCTDTNSMKIIIDGIIGSIIKKNVHDLGLE
jgi:hypothetical protein